MARDVLQTGDCHGRQKAEGVMDWTDSHNGTVRESPPYRLAQDEDGWTLTRRRRNRPIGVYPTVEDGIRAAEAAAVLAHERRVKLGKDYPGMGRPTRYRKDFDVHITVHRSGWEKVAKFAKHFKASKADTICGMIEAARIEDLNLPEPKLPG